MLSPLLFARQLRRNQTDAEKLLWSKLRANRFYGIKFKRQEILQGFIVDFVCYEHRIVIECDGGQHTEEVDRQRTKIIESAGFLVIRYWNNEILGNIDGILEDLMLRIGIKN